MERELVVAWIAKDFRCRPERASRILRQREKDVRNILVLHRYVEWARENGYLFPVVDHPGMMENVNYELLAGMLELKPYGKAPFKLAPCELAQLLSKKLFREFSKDVDLLIHTDLQRVLFLTPREFDMVFRAARNFKRVRKSYD